MTIYAGIGSRSTPPSVLQTMTFLAAGLGREGWLLRSGGADGADTAFEAGCDDVGGPKEIWLPWPRFNSSTSPHILSVLPYEVVDRATLIAANLHPAWERCTTSARKLHTRNIIQVLGHDLETIVDKVICWTPGGQIIGGTATAIRLAMQYDIEVINLAASKAENL